MKKVILLVLALAMLLFCFAGCKNGNNEESNAADVSSKGYTLSDKRFDGKILRILGKNGGSHAYAMQQWVGIEENKGEIINDTVEKRNNWLLENYGITVEYEEVSKEEYFITSKVTNLIQSGLDEFDLLCDGLTTMASLATNGNLYDLQSLEQLDLDNPWWDKAVTDNLSIDNKVYYAAGDILITDDEYTYCILFNKNLYTDNNIGEGYEDRTLYQVIDDGDWTYDTMLEMCKKCYSNIGNSGPMNYLEDVYGVIMDTGCVQVLMAGSGYKMAKKEDDIPYLDVQNEFALSVFNNVVELAGSGEYLLVSERIPSESCYGDAINVFGQNRALFYMTKLNGVSVMREFEDISFGIAPIPKYTKEQTDYYNTAAPLHFSLVGIPITNVEDLEMTCVALEALGYKGKEDLTEAYVETTLKLKRVEAQEDADMIDFILDNRAFDIATMFNWGELTSFFNKYAGSGITTFVSDWESKKPEAEADLQETLEAFKVA